LIVSQYGQSSRRPHQTCSRSPQGPPRGPQAPRAPGESTLAGAPPRAASLQPEPNSPLAARLSRAARSRGGGCSSGQQLAHPEHAVASAGVIEVIGLEVTTAISHHQLIIQLSDAHLQVGVLHQKLSIALLDVLNNAVLGLHLTGTLL
jgi:hypothetical protein